ncbi:MAG: hypothetical protein FJX62_11200 [Alphaproteobacteria bacterium]|nr:hypothetical protein [Alphaproteobacteria bacterium]
MPMLVHLTPEKNVPTIRRSGIAMSKWAGGVYATPVLPNFVVTHQWLRELKRSHVLTDGRSARTMHGVYFRIADDEPVQFGRYNDPPVTLPAARAVGAFMAAPDPLGFEIVVPRRITAKEIHRIRKLPQNMGWRYSPTNRTRWFCGCPMCNPSGGINARRKREQWEREGN